MTTPREKGGVVDKRLRLYSVRGLRVCDASVFPVMTRGNAITSVNAFGVGSEQASEYRF